MENRITMIRRQMEQTKGLFEQKLATLEEQVTKQVQSAGIAVNATAEAVQDAVHSVGNAFDVERQFRRHPWLFVGGAVAIGCIVTRLLKSRPPVPREPEMSGSPEMPPSVRTIPMTGVSQVSSPVAAELRRAATGAFTCIAQELVARSMPRVMQYFRGGAIQESSTQERRSDSGKPDCV
jgi:hypothetical protein